MQLYHLSMPQPVQCFIMGSGASLPLIFCIHVRSGPIYWGGLLALSIGQRLCVNFSVSIGANFLTTLRSHLDVTCSCYFGSSLFNVDVICSYIYLVN